MTDTEPFVALVIYPTTPEAQVKQADNLTRLVSEEIRLMPGFRSARVLLGEDGQSLVTLTEWSDRGSFESFRGSEFGQAAIRLVASLHPQTLWLREHTAIAAP